MKLGDMQNIPTVLKNNRGFFKILKTLNDQPHNHLLRSALAIIVLPVSVSEHMHS